MLRHDDVNDLTLLGECEPQAQDGQSCVLINQFDVDLIKADHQEGQFTL